MLPPAALGVALGQEHAVRLAAGPALQQHAERARHWPQRARRAQHDRAVRLALVPDVGRREEALRGRCASGGSCRSGARHRRPLRPSRFPRSQRAGCVADLISRTVAPGNEWWDAEAAARVVLLLCLLAVLWIRDLLGFGAFGRTLAILDLLAPCRPCPSFASLGLGGGGWRG